MNEEAIFHEALAKAPADRAAYVGRACAGDPALRAGVEALLRANVGATEFLESPPFGAPPTADLAAAEAPGAVIGPYKLLEPIGEGGMGTVWMAQQQQPVERVVALKLIKAGMDTKQVIARFEAERQALALMDHPNIARVLDAGTTDAGRPYFIMDLVKGVPITKYSDEHHLTTRQRLELFLPVCQAIQHAHQKGIIHRDLKPSNVLVALYDGRPVPKIIDFGVAKAAGQQLTDKTLVTGFGTIVGTLEYMSPEQAETNQLDIDTRSDIYSLGVLLYELLTGSTPLTHKRMKETAYAEILRMIKEEEPPKPSTRLSDSGEALASISANRHTEPAKLTKLVKGELDWIVMKALEKDRNRRYETANGFAMDVQRYLADEPVLACPPTVGYRLRKFVRRNKAALTMAGLVLFFVVLLGGVVGWGLRDREAREQEITLDRAKKLALTEEGIRQALDRGTKSRAELHAILKRPGGVQELLNQPARWELFIKTAHGELAQARRAAVSAEGGLDAELTQGTDTLERQLASDQADYDLARRLEKVRMDWAMLVNGRFDSRKSAEEYRQALAGFAVLDDDPAAVAARLGSSPIKEQLVAALDNWASLSLSIPQRATAEQLLALARQVAPDPVWGDRLRQIKLRRDREAVEKLAAETPPAGLSPQLYLLVGWSLIPKTNQRLRESWLRRAQAEHPADFWLNFHLAGMLEETSSVEASGFYRAALAARPGTSVVYNNLGKTLWDQKKGPEALTCYEKAIELDPKHAIAHYNRGVVLNHQKKHAEAAHALRKAIAIDPKDADSYSELGIALSAQGKLDELDEAIDACRKAIELDPKSAAVHNTLGALLCDGKHDYEGAAACFKKAIEIDPKNADSHYNLGNALDEQKKLPEAIDAYHKAIEIDPNFALAYFNLGFTLNAQGNLREAIDAYRKVTEIEPQNAKAYCYLGGALTRQGELDNAIAAFREAIKIDPENASAYNDLGWVLYEQKKLPEAIAAYRKAIELDPKDPLAHANLGWVQYRAGAWTESIKALEESCKLQAGGKDDCSQWIVLSLAHWKLSIQKELPEQERTRHKAEARRRYEQATKEIDQWGSVGPHDVQQQAVLDFREEARELMGAKETKK